MTIYHVVQFKFKPDVSEDKIEEINAHMLSLKSKCVHPGTQQTYIKSAVGGKDNSPEGLQNGYTHCYVMQFESADDRTYYVFKDLAHLDFVKGLKEAANGVQVLDFESA